MPKRIRRIQVPDEFEPQIVSDNTIFIILDIYLFSSTVATLFHTGVEKIYPVYDANGLHTYRQKDIPVGGEMAGNLDFTNSPQDVLATIGEQETVPKEVALTSSNGAKRTIECVESIQEQDAKNSAVYVGSPINAKALADYIKQNHEDHYIVFVSAGHQGQSTIEDVIGSVILSQYLHDETVYKTEYREILSMLPAGRIDRPEDFHWLSKADVEHISQVSQYNVVPKYSFEEGALVDMA